MRSYCTLFISLIFFTLVCNQAIAFSANYHISKTNKAIDTIWSGGKKTTGEVLYFKGNKRKFYGSSKAKTADRNFGNFLYYTYAMYCSAKSKKYSCLGSKLRVYFSIRSKNSSNKTMMIKIGNKTTVSNYFQEIRAKLFWELEKAYGKAKISSTDRYKIMPSPKLYARTNFKIVTNSKGHGNKAWTNTFITQMLDDINAKLGNAVRFRLKSKYLLKSNTLNKQNQATLLKTFYNKGTKGRITAVIASQKATDSMGLAYVQRSSKPIFVMNSCANKAANRAFIGRGTKADAICSGVALFLHELGHQMGLKHCSRNSDKVCTDNLATTRKGRRFLASYLTKNTSAVNVKYAY